ncbi:oxysterol binding protein [Lichtheimia corymbifera JMRC:FSU:9682]|uniref:Oxysterol binding protein n=1 Tax=Lichtheimia corymbifera JMRC:FSU:9682 TaxID=1263082 RepID=A0A068RXM8_9FUNG|nr:oxysterol binding protein [Lichtheimia corymbifera JMRC:FSU:9682]
MNKFFSNNRNNTSNDVNGDKEPSVNDVDNMSVKHAEPGTGGQFREFIKTVISFTGDLSSLTCPAFFLNGLSLLEYGTYWGDHPAFFTAISSATDPTERMLAVTRWFMSTLWGSYASRCTNGQHEKKPYNPILGEQFLCKLGDVECVCEQVCHHPPISAFYLQDEKAGVSLNGHSGQKARFKGTSIKTEQVGRAVLYVKQYDEQYVIDFPDLMIRGFLTGAAYLELAGVCTIACSNGHTQTTIEFVPKPWFGGEHNHIKGAITCDGEERYTLSGRWSHKTFVTKKGDSDKQLLFDAEEEPMAERKTAPIEEQQEIESHRLWGPVTEALKSKNYSVANAEKSKIEDWQRKVRKERADNNETWQPKLFKFVEDASASDTYSKRNVEMVQQMRRKALLDNGAWTYINSLHERKD